MHKHNLVSVLEKTLKGRLPDEDIAAIRLRLERLARTSRFELALEELAPFARLVRKRLRLSLRGWRAFRRPGQPA